MNNLIEYLKKCLEKLQGEKNADYTRRILGKQIREMRIDRRLTIYRVAKDTGLQSGQIKDIELARKNYTIDSYLAYINYLSNI